MCPRSSDPFYVVTYYIKWVTTSWTYSSKHELSDYIKLVTASWTHSSKHELSDCILQAKPPQNVHETKRPTKTKSVIKPSAIQG